MKCDLGAIILHVSEKLLLPFVIVSADSADDKLMTFFLNFPRK